MKVRSEGLRVNQTKKIKDLSRRRVEDAISEMGREEVLDARIVLAGACTPLQKLLVVCQFL